MTYLLIPLLCILASSKITIQSRFAKTQNTRIVDSIFFNGVIFTTAALLFLPSIIKNGVTLSTCIYGGAMGLLSVVFQFFYISAFSEGKMTLTVIINNFSMLLPMLVSFLLFDEEFGFSKIIGTLLALVSFVLSASKDTNSGKANLKWFIFTLLVFLSNGLISVNQKIYSMTTEKLQVFEFVAIAYIAASIISFLLLCIMAFKDKSFTLKKQPKIVFSGCLVGIILGVFQCVNTYAASVIAGTILYPAYNCGVSVLSAIIGRTFFKEKLSFKQYIGVCTGIIAIIFLCL